MRRWEGFRCALGREKPEGKARPAKNRRFLYTGYKRFTAELSGIGSSVLRGKAGWERVSATYRNRACDTLHLTG
jgi:hypothetical protein